jgi:hypothetical protein
MQRKPLSCGKGVAGLTSAVPVVLSGTCLTLAHPKNTGNIGLRLPRQRSESPRVVFDCVRLRLSKEG